MDWKTAQSSADDLLAEGLCALLSASKSKTHLQGAGNYLISLAGKPMYVGEAKDCRKRLAQQIDERLSTFYKNYRGLGSNPIQSIFSRFKSSLFPSGERKLRTLESSIYQLS